MNQEEKKKYEITEIAKRTIRTIEIKSIIGRDINKNNIIFHVLYSKMFFLEMRESKNRNIRNTKNGRNIIMPTNDTIGSGKGIMAIPINSHITITINLQFLPIFLKFSIVSIEN
jgi:hypothetical protein